MSLPLDDITGLILAGGRWLLPVFVPPIDAAAREAVAVGLLVLWPAAAYQAFDGLYFGSASATLRPGDDFLKM